MNVNASSVDDIYFIGEESSQALVIKVSIPDSSQAVYQIEVRRETAPNVFETVSSSWTWDQTTPGTPRIEYWKANGFSWDSGTRYRVVVTFQFTYDDQRTEQAPNNPDTYP